jgi:SAM-dependent methyltransferase
MTTWAWIVIGGLVLWLAYWALILTEGTYLGAPIVVLMYDWVARRYDRIKDVRYVNEMAFLGIPLRRALEQVAKPLILDVATGTGRMPLALVRQLDYDGLVVGVELSRRMLAEAQRALAGFDHATLVRGDASALSFADASFDALTCLEALEFMAQPQRVLGELVRVVKPGGVLLLSNRIGSDAGFFPGRLAGRGRLERGLQALGLDTRMERWQTHYDLVWATKPLLPGSQNTRKDQHQS